MKKILIVDDEPNNLQLLRQILKDDYPLTFATSGAMCLEMAQAQQPDLILLDIMMPDMNGYEVCQKLKNLSDTSHIPVIFITAMSDIEDEAKGFDVGGVDYIQKPISPPIVRRRVHTHLSLVRAKELEYSQKAAIYMLGEAGHYNDTDTGVHIWRMAAYAKEIAQAAGWPPEKSEWLELAAPMHDTGKIGIPDYILKAPRQLTSDEWDIMKQHSRIGYEILRMCKTDIFQLAAEIAYYHHERWDGLGYPCGLKAQEIPESARIVSIADVFDALTMQRPYKEAWDLETAVEEINKNSGGQFDPALVELFNKSLNNIITIKLKWDEFDSENRLPPLTN